MTTSVLWLLGVVFEADASLVLAGVAVSTEAKAAGDFGRFATIVPLHVNNTAFDVDRVCARVDARPERASTTRVAFSQPIGDKWHVQT